MVIVNGKVASFMYIFSLDWLTRRARFKLSLLLLSAIKLIKRKKTVLRTLPTICIGTILLQWYISESRRKIRFVHFLCFIVHLLPSLFLYRNILNKGKVIGFTTDNPSLDFSNIIIFFSFFCGLIFYPPTSWLLKTKVVFDKTILQKNKMT